MKQSVIKIFAAVFSAALVLSSCSRAAQGVEIKDKSVSGAIRAGGSTAVYTYEVYYPEIKIPGNKDAAKKINAAVYDEVRKIAEPEFDYAAEYEEYIARGAQYVSGASYSESFEKTRCDDEIISFEISLYRHEACAVRDTEETKGMTFSLKTGNTVSVYDIAADGDRFREKLSEQTEKQLSALGKEKGTGDISLEDAFALIDSNAFEWYVTDEALCILFAPGDAAPIMLGTLKVEIPVEEVFNQPSNGSTASVSGVSS